MSSIESYLSAQISVAKSVTDDAYDGIVYISHSVSETAKYEVLKSLLPSLTIYSQIHKDIENTATLILIDGDILPSRKLIFAGTGPVNRDHDDVRRFNIAARNGMKLALKTGMKAPLILTLPHEKYPQAELVSALGALHELYTLVNLLEALDAAFTVCRDVGDSDPQRMSPSYVAQYVTNAFSGTNISTRIISEVTEIEHEFPLMAAVNRAANNVKDHQARLIWLEYNPEGPYDETIMLVGKGVTIDTGGADLKTNGNMFGMCRDKYGAAVVAGIFKALEILKPRNIKFCGYMCMVRNSIGSNAYTCDEIIRSRSGKRIAICNTDAEGRITMLDPLTKMVELVIVDLATRYMAAAMDNGPARANHTAETIRNWGDIFGQPVEVSRLHWEDFEFHDAESEAADIRQSNTLPSVRTLRGHQGPAAFLLKGSRLDEHGCDSKTPIA
ncbi:putative aminopeptidase W07G4.4 [Dirofilaria immitis]|nr:putative aminopeptidase W07G4.4 [Dirofilaria immitis]